MKFPFKKSFFASLRNKASKAVQPGPPEPLLKKLRQGFDASYYLSQNVDVAEAGIDPFVHYMRSGWRENRRPNGWFDPQDYIARHPHLLGGTTNPFAHFLERKGASSADLANELKRLQMNRYLFWADQTLSIDGKSHPVIMSAGLPKKEDLLLVKGAFDAEFYLDQNPEVASCGIDPLLHFMTVGWLEQRDPSPAFSVSYYLKCNKDVRGARINPYVHFLRNHKKETWRRWASVDDSVALLLFGFDAEMLDRVSRAKRLDPMVAMPNVPRTLTSPLKAQAAPTDVGVLLRKQLAGKQYRYIVAVPHVRMSGASRVASIFAEALSGIYDPSEILVVTTDSSDHEYMDWFSDEIDVFDLSKEISALGPEHKIKALIDVMRGVNCQTIINVNSRLLWEAMRMYGRQIHHEFRVVTYLFTWDETPKGDRVGYPIQWLRDTADHHHLLLTDTKNLADDVSDRLGFGHLANGGQVVPLYTPIDQSEVTAAPSESDSGEGHFLWAGRFDPQKRLDVLVAIAKANPNMTFDVYGKTVLSKADLASYNPPKNIHHKGTYTDLQEVLDTPYSGFLYTAQWDGLPTILLDMAAAGLPIVAPDVGGISELLDNTTGWLIDDFQDVDGYSAALAEMAKNHKEAASRAAALKLRLADGFTFEHYTNRIKEMVNTYEL